jgi:glycosyltransferase involved in cell wall biosynthesis
VSGARISVVVPVFQGERFLAAALDSIHRQSLPADEVVVVDDGSTDRSAAIAIEMAERWPALRVLRRENGGPSVATNHGIGATTGEFLTFLDADDLMVETRLEQQARHLGDHPGTDLVIGREEVLVEEGAVAPAWIRAADDGTPRPYMMSMMVRRAAFDRVGGFDPSLRASQDLDWMVRARAAGLRMDILDAVLIRRRMHGDNLVYGTAAIRQGMLRALRGRLDRRDEPT